MNIVFIVLMVNYSKFNFRIFERRIGRKNEHFQQKQKWKIQKSVFLFTSYPLKRGHKTNNVSKTCLAYVHFEKRFNDFESAFFWSAIGYGIGKKMPSTCPLKHSRAVISMWWHTVPVAIAIESVRTPRRDHREFWNSLLSVLLRRYLCTSACEIQSNSIFNTHHAAARRRRRIDDDCNTYSPTSE